jgi:hypothetical protein
MGSANFSLVEFARASNSEVVRVPVMHAMWFGMLNVPELQILKFWPVFLCMGLPNPFPYTEHTKSTLVA